MPPTPVGLCAVRASSPQINSLYGSAIGTTVLQLKELPPRPREYDGKLCLFDVAPSVDEAAIKAALVPYGDIVSCTLGKTARRAIVCFATHAAAQAAKRAAAQLVHIAGGVDTLFNERSYDGRHGEAGLDDDEGRGWCVFESAVSGELILRLSVVPRLKAELDKLPPKMLQLRSGCPLETVDLSAGRLETRVADVVARIEGATFTGKGDKAMVINLYKTFVDRIAVALQRLLPKMLASHGATAAPPEPLPQVDAPAAAPLRLASGQPLLLLSRDAGGRPRFGVVDATGGRVAAAVTGGDVVELAYDRCSQAVLPWRPPAAGWEAAFVGDARALRDLAEPARHLADDARRMESESALRAVGERAREIAHSAARCQTLAHAAREAGGAVQSCVDAAAALFQEQKQGDRTQLQAALGKVREAVERLQLEAMATTALRSSGASGARRYATGQPLTVRTAGGWRDADVAAVGADGLSHGLTFLEGSVEPPATLTLHPWNHAPRELPQVAFEALRACWTRELRAQHGGIADALTGHRLDALQQCVAISVTGVAAAEAEAAAISDAHGLLGWLLAQHGAQLEGRTMEAPRAALLTAGPASGKTTLLSQVVTLALQDEHTELVPILVKVQVLQQRLLEAPDAFASAWNYIDAYLRLEHEASRPALYRMLRQAMMARRALLLLDGLDEAGAKRADIELHVVEVLAPQGHVLLCTSRPAGVDEARFAAFRRLELAPLSDAQQERALEQRLGAERAAALLPYVRDTVPRDDKGQKVTSNPLMLSMVASVYELRQGIGMPATVAELYATASDAMLARGGVASAELLRLLQRIFFEAHVAQRRLIEDRQLDEAALGLEAPEALAKIRAEAATAAATMPFELFFGRAELGHYVEVMKRGKHKGKRGVITTDDKTRPLTERHNARTRGRTRGRMPPQMQERAQYKVTFANGTVSGWLEPDELHSSGLDETAVLQRAMVARAPAVRAACEARLSVALRTALRTVRERVLVDALPLLSLVQSEPLRLQSSHLSFQEYFAARALCEEGTKLSGTPPWQWPAWWANAVELGAQMGDGFGRGLLRAAGVTGGTLDLSQKLGGDPPTVRRVLAAVVAGAVLTSLDVGHNNLNEQAALGIVRAARQHDKITNLGLSGCGIGPIGATEIADYIQFTAVLKNLSVANNNIDGEAAKQLAMAVLNCSSLEVLSGVPIKKLRAGKLTKLKLQGKGLGATEGIVLAELMQLRPVLTSLDVGRNNLNEQAALSIVRAARQHDKITNLGLSGCGIGPIGAKEIADYIQFTAALKSCNLLKNGLDVESATMLAKIGAEKGIMLSGMSRDQTVANFEHQDLEPADAILIASDLRLMAVLTSLDLNSNNIGDEGAKAIAEALKRLMAVLTSLDLNSNNIGDEGAKAIAEALKVNAVFRGFFWLRLECNNIGDEGAKAIAEALEVNAVLTKLNLCGNKKRFAEEKAFRDAVKSNMLKLPSRRFTDEVHGRGSRTRFTPLLMTRQMALLRPRARPGHGGQGRHRERAGAAPAPDGPLAATAEDAPDGPLAATAEDEDEGGGARVRVPRMMYTVGFRTASSSRHTAFLNRVVIAPSPPSASCRCAR
jgi:Ran GTPase-activating protein (RanGAP) involved in mRNA processing and transport